jgi:hypothetical protein
MNLRRHAPTSLSSPDLMPVLSRGSHRSPRKGACFMELASFLAGEKWSDHPSCTHPLLAALARDVNDCVTDEARSRLAPLIPRVIGLNGDDERVDAWIARGAALAALPHVAFAKQGVAVVGMLSCERYLNSLDGRDDWVLCDETLEILRAYPLALEWARKLPALSESSPSAFRRRSAPTIVHSAVSGIAASTAHDIDAILVDLLEQTIADCETWFGHEPEKLPEPRWQEAVSLTVR